MDDDGGPGGPGPKVIAGDMIGMAVGVDNPAQPPAFLVQAFGQDRGRAARVEEERLLTFRAGHQIGEDPKRPHGFGEDI